MPRRVIAVFAAVCLFALGCSRESAPAATETSEDKANAAIAEALRKAAEGPALSTAADSIAPPLMHWKQWGRINKYVRVKSGVTDAEMLELGRALHKAEPETWFWMIDDDSAIPDLKAVLAGSPEDAGKAVSEEKGKALQAWQWEHTKGRVTQFTEVVDEKAVMRWGVMRGFGYDVEKDKIAVLE
jgi:hypothetical protein